MSGTTPFDRSRRDPIIEYVSKVSVINHPMVELRFETQSGPLSFYVSVTRDRIFRKLHGSNVTVTGYKREHSHQSNKTSIVDYIKNYRVVYYRILKSVGRLCLTVVLEKL